MFALRYSAYSFAYMATAHSLSVAYNRCNPLDHAAAGFLTGALYRLPSGYRPALAAGIIGAGMGLIIGSGFWIAHMARGNLPLYNICWLFTQNAC